MLFGFFNTLAIFQKYINKILIEKLDILVIIYLDKILIYIKDPGQLYIKIMQKVLKQLWEYFFLLT